MKRRNGLWSASALKAVDAYEAAPFDYFLALAALL